MATIVIDPGHYEGYNPGICPGYYEGNTMLTLSFLLGDNLKCRGANVLYTRTTNEQNPSLAERGRMAADADLFISMHSDAGAPEARGVTSYYSVQQPFSQPLAESIGMAAAGAMPTPFRGTIARPYPNNPDMDYYGVIRAAVAAGAKNAFIIEHGFHTNPEDCAILSDPDALERIAQAETMVIADYFGLLSGRICCDYTYVVQPRDSIYLIGQMFRVPWQTIAVVNDIFYPYTIFPGEVLIIPMQC